MPGKKKTSLKRTPVRRTFVRKTFPKRTPVRKTYTNKEVIKSTRTAKEAISRRKATKITQKGDRKGRELLAQMKSQILKQIATFLKLDKWEKDLED